MTEQPAGGRVRRTKPIEPPVFDPDPEIVDHLEGSARAIRGYKRAMAKLVAQALAERTARLKA